MRVNEITSLREALDIRQVQGGYEIFDTETGRKAPNTLIYGSEGDAESARDRIRAATRPTTPRTDGSTVSPAAGNNKPAGAGKPTDIERVVLKSERGINPVKYALVQYDGTPINKTGSVSEFFDDLDKHDPALRATLKAEADKAKADAEDKYKKRKGSFVRRMKYVNFFAWLFASGAQVYEAMQLMSMAQRQVGTYKQDFFTAFMNYMVPAIGDVGAITATFFAQHYVGGRFIGGALMAGKVKSGNFWRAAANALDGRSKSTRWWQQFHPRKIVGDVLAYIFGAAAANAVSQYYLRQIGLLEEWAMWEFLNRDFVPIIADITGASEDDVSNAVNVPDKPDINVSESDIDAAIEAVKNNEVQEILDQTEEAIDQYEKLEKGSDFWN